MYLFNEKGMTTQINIEDIYCVRRDPVARRSLYHNGAEWLYAANTINELAKLYEAKGFIKIDKNKLINLHHVSELKNGVLHINGSEYLVSRRNLEVVEDMLRKITVPIRER